MDRRLREPAGNDRSGRSVGPFCRTFQNVSSDAVISLASALLGALVGGVASFAIASRGARRDRRARYGEAMLATLGVVHSKVAAARADPAAPVELRDEAISLWAQAELACTLEWRRGRREMRAWVHRLHDTLINVKAGDTDLAALERQLDLGVYLVIAWTAREATGQDFARPAQEIDAHFGFSRD